MYVLRVRNASASAVYEFVVHWKARACYLEKVKVLRHARGTCMLVSGNEIRKQDEQLKV